MNSLTARPAWSSWSRGCGNTRTSIRTSKLPGILPDPFENLLVVPLRLHFLKHVPHLAVFSDDEGRAGDAHVLLAIHALLLPDAVALGDGMVGVGEQREVQVELIREPGHLLD